MDDITKSYDLIYNSTYYVCAQSSQTYLLFFKELIQKYLSDIKQYQIIVSTTSSLLTKYQKFMAKT